MKILIISNSLWNLNNFRKNLILNINNNYETGILCEKNNSNSVLDIPSKNVFYIKFNSNSFNLFSNLYLFLQILKVIIKFKPDLILSFTIKPNIFSSIISRFINIKNIVNITGLGTVFLKNPYLSFLFKIVYYFSLKKTSLIYFQNEFDQKYFIKNKIIRSQNYKIIQGSGVDLKKFYYRKLNDNKEITFSFISRLIVEKGIIELLSAIKTIKLRYPNTIFNIIGSIDQKNNSSINFKDIEDLKKSNYINHYNFTDDVIRYITKSDCIILPSYREGSSKILLEAAAIGRPLIASDVPGCNNIVINNFNGFLCKPRDTNSLIDSIEKFIKLDIVSRKKLAQNSRKHIEENFDEKFVINQYLNDINHILNEKKN